VLLTRQGLLLMSRSPGHLPFTPTPILFFTGKGGVGKTSLACAMAIAAADQGRRVLLVSTDPASNLDEVLGTRLANEPRPIHDVPRLSALNINPEEAARAYRERVVGPYRHLLPPATVARMEEQLSGACTTEIAAFDEFTGLLGGERVWADYDHVIFDTAPTGHTLRLLNLPAAWDAFIETNSTGTSCLGPLSGLKSQHATYKASLTALQDPRRTTVVLVARPDNSALAEADRTRAELESLGIGHQRLVVNGWFVATDRSDPVAVALEARAQAALDAAPAGLLALPRIQVPLLPWAPIGAEALRRVFGSLDAVAERPTAPPAPTLDEASFGRLIDVLGSARRGVVLTMGKGGVGKTTIAAAVALGLAQRGHRVHLSTTDPASHLEPTLAGAHADISVSRIDPARETQRYVEEVLATTTGLDERGRALLEEDLRSPCTEEIAVFRAFARVVALGQDGFVVLDTAPTGHTLLLLDAAEAYHREVARTRTDVPEEVRHLLPRLRDPSFARVLLVTLPEATPVHEAAHLQDDLRRAGIEPFAWVVNQSLTGASVRDPVLKERAALETPYMDEVRQHLARRVAFVSWRAVPPVGAGGLRALTSPAAAGP
jgi:arsenite/tail-anchored protein-transporting ATPase